MNKPKQKFLKAGFLLSFLLAGSVLNAQVRSIKKAPSFIALKSVAPIEQISNSFLQDLERLARLAA